MEGVPLFQTKDFSMVAKQEIPLLGLMIFILVYSTIGDPENPIWSGLYFIVNYVTLFVLFKSHKSRTIRLIGISLSVSIIIFIILKYFVNWNCERIYTFVPFLICLIGLILLEKNELRKRKNL